MIGAIDIGILDDLDDLDVLGNLENIGAWCTKPSKPIQYDVSNAITYM